MMFIEGPGGLPLFTQQKGNGLQTNVPLTFGGALTFNGAVTFTGTASFTGSKTGGLNNVLGSSGNTAPTAAQSTSTLLFDSATGIKFTLPAPVVGLEYNFFITTTVTSGSHEIATSSTSVFLIGGVNMVIATSATTLGALGDGATHDAITMNGTTTGGKIGTYLKLTCINSTQWLITGIVMASGSLATPFATSQ